MGLLILSSSSFASIVKTFDAKKGCNLYRLELETDKAREKGEKIVYEKAVYGMTFEDMEIDYDKREARVQVMINVVMGFNRNIGEKSSIEERNPESKKLVNLLNKKLTILEKVCITDDSKIVYVKIKEGYK